MKISSFFIFLLLCMFAYALGLSAVIFFPNNKFDAHLGRIVLYIIGVSVLVIGNNKLLQRDGFDPQSLGLALRLKNLSWFLLGVAGGCFLIISIYGVLWLFVPFHLERGELSLAQFFMEAHAYFWGGLGEELIFRAYLLISLVASFGRSRALWILALAFGLFHLPGLSGIEALKMVLTTGAAAFIFSYAFFISKTLWTAVGAHMAMNVMLHSFTAYWKPVFDVAWPTAYDPAFLICFVLSSLVAFLLWMAHKRKTKTKVLKLTA